MMHLVPRQPFGSLASAIAGQLRSHVDSIGQGSPAYHQLCSDYQVGPLSGEEGKTPASPAHVLDASEASNERIRNPEGFQHFPAFYHDDLHSRPREDRLVGTHPTGSARETIRPYAIVSARGFQFVSEAVA